MDLEKFLSYDYYLFDCDGVILDSNQAKTTVFYDVALKYTNEENANKLKEYHVNHGGISRFQKLEYFFKEILSRSVFEEDLIESLELFKRLSLERCIQCNTVKGVEECLGLLDPSKNFIVSGAAESDLHQIFKIRKLDIFFKYVYGSPKSKFEIVDAISPKGKVLFIGDSKLDYYVADKYEFDFLYVSSVSEWKEGLELVGRSAYHHVKDFSVFL